MKIAWTLGGALVGRILFGGKLGMVVGGVLGYAMAPEEGAGSRSGLRKSSAPAFSAGEAALGGDSRGAERYPEETIIDAMQEEVEEHPEGEGGGAGRPT